MNEVKEMSDKGFKQKTRNPYLEQIPLEELLEEIEWRSEGRCFVIADSEAYPLNAPENGGSPLTSLEFLGERAVVYFPLESRVVTLYRELPDDAAIISSNWMKE